MPNRPDRRDVLKGIGTSAVVVAGASHVNAGGRSQSSNAGATVGEITTKRRLQATEALLKGSLGSPITPEAILDAQDDTLSGMSQEFDLPRPEPSEEETIVAYSHRLDEDGIPEVYTGVVTEDDRVDTYDVQIKEMHESAEANVDGVHAEQGDFVDADPAYHKTLNTFHEKNDCPLGSLTTKVRMFTLPEMGNENRFFATRSLTYPGYWECDESWGNVNLETIQHYDFDKMGVKEPTITNRVAEIGEEVSEGHLNLGYAGNGLSIPLSGPNSAKSDQSTTDKADLLYSIQDNKDSQVHSIGTAVEWDGDNFDLCCGDYFAKLDNTFRVHSCSDFPIFECPLPGEPHDINEKQYYYQMN